MDKVTENELIQIYLWIEDLTRSYLDECILEEAGPVPVWSATSEEVDEYLRIMREVVSREYTALNEKFLQQYFDIEKRKILHICQYGNYSVVEATKDEIIAFAKLTEVTGISFYEELIPSND